jgi:L-asparaginase
MKRVAVIFTGGTISMQVDRVAGGNVPVLDGAGILARVPGIEEIAELRIVDLGRTPASHFSFDQLFAIVDAIRAALAGPGIAGVVVVQGTDVLEETAFFWDLLIDDPRPVVVTGAMRSASQADDDGPQNLRDAVRCAVAADLRGAGVLVCLAGTVHAADDVTKTHASALDTFQSLNAGPVARIEGDRVRLLRRRGRRRHVVARRAAERVRLVTAAVAMDGSVIDALRSVGIDGLVVEATGAGNTDSRILAAAERVMASGAPVVLATRCAAGAAGTGYAFPGGGATWVRAGALLPGHLSGPKARIALALGIGAGLDRDGLAALLADPAEAA